MSLERKVSRGIGVHNIKYGGVIVYKKFLLCTNRNPSLENLLTIFVLNLRLKQSFLVNKCTHLCRFNDTCYKVKLSWVTSNECKISS